MATPKKKKEEEEEEENEDEDKNGDDNQKEKADQVRWIHFVDVGTILCPVDVGREGYIIHLHSEWEFPAIHSNNFLWMTQDRLKEGAGFREKKIKTR